MAKKKCIECKGAGKVPDRVPCQICGGRGHIIKDKKPTACPGGCIWGKVETGILVTCLDCKGLGIEPEFNF